jgi:dolichol-phosphate mannosyltransferase
LDFLALALSKITKTKIPVRFFNFLLVGSSGVGGQLVLLRQGLNVGLSFSHAQLIATVIAMTSNFLLNNALTYRDRRVAGWNLVPALLSFYAVCSVGAVSNIGVASWFYSQRPVWWLAGIGGSVIGAVWNYAASSVFVWARR